MKQAILYVHGQGGSASEADRYATLCPAYDAFGLDYHGATPWDTQGETLALYRDLRRKYGGVTLIANSIGAYFALNALQGERVSQTLLISPIVDMERLICDMMRRADVTETELRERREIVTATGETLSWEYLSYVRGRPLVWTPPTRILYGERDNFTSMEIIRAFAARCAADLTVMPDGEHWFHTPEQMAFHDAWAKQYLT